MFNTQSLTYNIIGYAYYIIVGICRLLKHCSLSTSGILKSCTNAIQCLKCCIKHQVIPQLLISYKCIVIHYSRNHAVCGFLYANRKLPELHANIGHLTQDFQETTYQHIRKKCNMYIVQYVQTQCTFKHNKHILITMYMT